MPECMSKFGMGIFGGKMLYKASFNLSFLGRQNFNRFSSAVCVEYYQM